MSRAVVIRFAVSTLSLVADAAALGFQAFEIAKRLGETLCRAAHAQVGAGNCVQPREARRRWRPPATARVGSAATRCGVGDAAPRLGQHARDPPREHQPLEQRVRREAVGAVEPAGGDLTRRVEAAQRRASVDVDEHAAHHVVRRRCDRHEVARQVVARLGAYLPDGREAGTQARLSKVASVEPYALSRRQRRITRSISRLTTSRGASSASGCTSSMKRCRSQSSR